MIESIDFLAESMLDLLVQLHPLVWVVTDAAWFLLKHVVGFYILGWTVYCLTWSLTLFSPRD